MEVLADAIQHPEIRVGGEEVHVRHPIGVPIFRQGDQPGEELLLAQGQLHNGDGVPQQDQLLLGDRRDDRRAVIASLAALGNGYIELRGSKLVAKVRLPILILCGRLQGRWSDIWFSEPNAR